MGAVPRWTLARGIDERDGARSDGLLSGNAEWGRGLPMRTHPTLILMLDRGFLGSQLL